MDAGYPFVQQKINESTLVRTFFPDVDSEELVWHRDRETRLIEVLEGNDWCYQSDNQLPVEIKTGDKFLIHAKTWHRVIKGSDILKVKITIHT